MFRVIQQGSQYFVRQDEHVTRAGPYEALCQAQLAAAWLSMRASRPVAPSAKG
jgi:hypothetical protein